MSDARKPPDKVWCVLGVNGTVRLVMEPSVYFGDDTLYQYVLKSKLDAALKDLDEVNKAPSYWFANYDGVTAECIKLRAELDRKNAEIASFRHQTFQAEAERDAALYQKGTADE